MELTDRWKGSIVFERAGKNWRKLEVQKFGKYIGNYKISGKLERWKMIIEIRVQKL